MSANDDQTQALDTQSDNAPSTGRKIAVLVVHNYYQERGGEDAVFEAEAELLARGGHRVERLTLHNQDIADVPGVTGGVRLAARTTWSHQSYLKVKSLLRSFEPEIVHFHNTFPLISPSGYAACRQSGVPVIQTLHNYRLLCPSATFFRDNRPCEDCLARTPWPGILHACYRNSRSQTAVVTAMLTAHRLRQTWVRDVCTYITLTAFGREKFIQGGLPANKIAVKPNFLFPSPGIGSHDGDFALFVGRLAPNKGVTTLLRAWGLLKNPVPLRIVGDGPLSNDVRQAAQSMPSIQYEGRLTRDAVLNLMARARFLIFPSQWYECFPVTIVEAFACGLPVIASRLGAMVEIINDSRNGLHFTPGNSADLAAKVQWAWTHPNKMGSIGMEGRQEYEAKYTAEKNYDQLMRIYSRALTQQKRDVSEKYPIKIT